METYNTTTKQWKKLTIPDNKEVEAIVGKCEIITDGLGNISINKILTADEKTRIEALANGTST